MSGRNIVDIKDQRFGRLIALRCTGRERGFHAVWLCRCDCGKKVNICGTSLRTGVTKSCGCWAKEKKYKHGYGVHNPEYRAWSSMRQRCENPSAHEYSRYGGRGIVVCDRWNPKKGGLFKNFLDDMGLRSKGTSLERIDNDGNYEPSNRRWATFKEQIRNCGLDFWAYEKFAEVVG